MQAYTFCFLYRCNNCDCEFYYPIKLGNNSATENNSVICPKCNSDNCYKY